MSSRRIPPVRRCPGCGTLYRAWKQDACSDCLQDPGKENRQEGAKMAREARLKRRGQDDSDPDNRRAAEARVVELEKALRDLEPLLDALAAMGWLKGEAALGIVRAALAEPVPYGEFPPGF